MEKLKEWIKDNYSRVGFALLLVALFFTAFFLWPSCSAHLARSDDPVVTPEERITELKSSVVNLTSVVDDLTEINRSLADINRKLVDENRALKSMLAHCVRERMEADNKN